MSLQSGGQTGEHVLAFAPQCSAECGAGVRTRSVVCMTNHISSLPLEGCGNNRPSETTPCDNGPCAGKVEWFAGGWTQVNSISNRCLLSAGSLIFKMYFCAMKMCAGRYFYLSVEYFDVFFLLCFAGLMFNTFQHLLVFYFDENKILLVSSSVPSFLFLIY